MKIPIKVYEEIKPYFDAFAMEMRFPIHDNYDTIWTEGVPYRVYTIL